MLFGDKVKLLAAERGMTQKDIVLKTGMSKSLVSMIWNNVTTDPRLETIILFSKAFEVSVSELVDGVNVPRNKKADRNAAKV